MQLGMVGLGRMGANIVRRLQRAGHECVVYDHNADRSGRVGRRRRDRRVVARRSRAPSSTRRARCGSWSRPASRATSSTSSSRHSNRATSSSTAATASTATTSRARPHSSQRGIDYVDCGTSGGVWGLERGYCLMIGGPDDAFAHLDPIFRALAPGVDAAPRTPGRTGEPDARGARLSCTAGRPAPATS